MLTNWTGDFNNGFEHGPTFLIFRLDGRRIEQSWQKIDFIRAKVFIVSARIASLIRLLSIWGPAQGLSSSDAHSTHARVMRNESS